MRSTWLKLTMLPSGDHNVAKDAAAPDFLGKFEGIIQAH